MNLAKLNYVLIPDSAAQRERWRARPIGRGASHFVRLWQVLTPRGRVFLLILALTAGFSVDLATTQVHLLFSALVGVFAAVWLARRGFPLHGVRVKVRTPKRIAVGDHVGFQLGVENTGQGTVAALRVRGPFLPWDGTWTGAAPLIERLEAGEKATVECRARFVARGQHQLDPFVVQAIVPLGLTLGPAVFTEPANFLVVPRIAPVAHLETPVTRRHQPGGMALASKTGESMDLIGIRDYRPGDPLRDLHARSWARFGRPVVREYQEEYFTRIGVVVDTDALRGSERHLEAALSLAAGIVEHLSRGEALIDLLVVGNQVHTLTLGRSLGFLDQALDLLACVSPSGKFDASATASHLAPHLARLSCLVFVALSWDSEQQSFVDRIQGTGVACRTVVVLPPASKRRPARTHGIREAPFVTKVGTEAIEQGRPLWL